VLLSWLVRKASEIFHVTFATCAVYPTPLGTVPTLNTRLEATLERLCLLEASTRRSGSSGEGEADRPRDSAAVR
jgi:hypothetical protein